MRCSWTELWAQYISSMGEVETADTSIFALGVMVVCIVSVLLSRFLFWVGLRMIMISFTGC